jgi:hypothetical protein
MQKLALSGKQSMGLREHPRDVTQRPRPLWVGAGTPETKTLIPVPDVQ